MKLLLLYCSQFSWNPTIETLEFAGQSLAPASLKNVQVALIQAEAADVDKESTILRKMLKNLKWACGKNNTTHIVLHSFAHLSESKAPPQFTFHLLRAAQERLESSGYRVAMTPFGYFHDLQISAPGHSLARIFKDL